MIQKLLLMFLTYLIDKGSNCSGYWVPESLDRSHPFGQGCQICDHIRLHAGCHTFLILYGMNVYRIGPCWILLILLQITSEHPQIETITPDGLSKKFFDGVRYDLVVTFSSIEHSGLGRYITTINKFSLPKSVKRSVSTYCTYQFVILLKSTW